MKQSARSDQPFQRLLWDDPGMGVGMLMRLTCYLVRMDGGYAAPEIFALLEVLRVENGVNMGKNEVLKR